MNLQPATPQNITKAASLLNNGKLVAFPTETVYGLAADACNDAAVAEIFAAKGRPSFNPLIIHFADFSTAKEFVIWNERAEI
ncbi:MAG: Sua5/YciO/YrdC/YwlC family protein, partial [Pseudomonadota bacterium]